MEKEMKKTDPLAEAKRAFAMFDTVCPLSLSLSLS